MRLACSGQKRGESHVQEWWNSFEKFSELRSIGMKLDWANFQNCAPKACEMRKRSSVQSKNEHHLRGANTTLIFRR